MPEPFLSPQKARQLVWNGHAARCSNCAWEKPYAPRGTRHYFPTEEISKSIRGDFQAHRCEQYEAVHHEVPEISPRGRPLTPSAVRILEAMPWLRLPLHAERFPGRTFRRSPVERMKKSSQLNHNPLDLIERNLIATAIIESGRARGFVRGHLLGHFQFPAIA